MADQPILPHHCDTLPPVPFKVRCIDNLGADLDIGAIYTVTRVGAVGAFDVVGRPNNSWRSERFTLLTFKDAIAEAVKGAKP